MVVRYSSSSLCVQQLAIYPYRGCRPVEPQQQQTSIQASRRIKRFRRAHSVCRLLNEYKVKEKAKPCLTLWEHHLSNLRFSLSILSNPNFTSYFVFFCFCSCSVQDVHGAQHSERRNKSRIFYSACCTLRCHSAPQARPVRPNRLLITIPTK